MRFGLAMSSREQTGQSEAIHSPDYWSRAVNSKTCTHKPPKAHSLKLKAFSPRLQTRAAIRQQPP
jgi:hypothetical protein